MAELVTIKFGDNKEIKIDPRAVELAFVKVNINEIDRLEHEHKIEQERLASLPFWQRPFNASYWQNKRLGVYGGKTRAELVAKVEELEKDIKNNPL